MSDATEQTPSTSPSDSPPPTQHSVETRTRTTIVVRRSPKYARLLILGLVVGILTAAILTVSFPASAEFSQGQVFGFLALICAAIGAGLFGLIAIILDRTVGRKGREMPADKVEKHLADSPNTATTTQQHQTTEGSHE